MSRQLRMSMTLTTQVLLLLNTISSNPLPHTQWLFPTDAFDFTLMVDTLRKLKEGKHVEIPVYDFSTHSRAKYTVSDTLHSYVVPGDLHSSFDSKPCTEPMWWCWRAYWHSATRSCCNSWTSRFLWTLTLTSG